MNLTIVRKVTRIEVYFYKMVGVFWRKQDRLQIIKNEIIHNYYMRNVNNELCAFNIQL